MNENIENVVKIETKGFQDLCNHIRELEEKNKQLENENKTLKEENTYFKARNLALAKRGKKLLTELHDIKSMSMFEFGNTYCSDDSLAADGKTFARSLLGKPMDPVDIEEAEFIEKSERQYYEMGTALYGDDF